MSSFNSPGFNPLSYEGDLAVTPPDVIKALRNPATTDLNYQIGTIWINTSNNTNWTLTSVVSASATWTVNGSGATGGIVTITGDSGGAESPNAGNFNILGTANQVRVAGSANTETISLIGPYTPSTYTAHGVLVGEGTSSIAALAVGTTGQVLIGSTGADPAFGALGVNSGLTAHGVLLGENNSAIAATAAGTNGQVFLGSTGADPAFGTLTSTGGSVTYTTGAASLNLDVASSFLAQTTITLTSAQVKALRATPITVVAAPGANKSIFLIAAQLKSIYGGTNAFTGPQNLALRYQNGSGTIISNTITGAGFLDQTANEYQIVGISASSTITAATVVENQPLVIHNTGAAEITGNAAGDNTIKVTVTYAILTQ